MKPYSDSCDRNQQPILDLLLKEFSGTKKVLEIGSGTGQHAVYFATRLRHLVWQTSDLAENHEAIKCWTEELEEPCLCAPLELDVTSPRWPDMEVDGVFSANTSHIMHWDAVCAMLAGVGTLLGTAHGGRFCLYGPFNEDGAFTSDSNRKFDAWLKDRDPLMGLRDVGAIEEIADTAELVLQRQHRMPANNLMLVFDKDRSAHV